jgi:hypothetical protein
LHELLKACGLSTIGARTPVPVSVRGEFRRRPWRSCAAGGGGGGGWRVSCW